MGYLDRFIKDPATFIKYTSHSTSKLSKDSTVAKSKHIVIETTF